MVEKDKKIPDATIERIALYSRPLENLMKGSVSVISSENLADLCRVNPAQVRKDLSYFGEFGVRGVGYDVQDLLSVIKKILASDRFWRLGIAGMGSFGMAVIQHENFLKRGYKFVAAFDSNPKYHGKTLANGLTIKPLDEIGNRTRELGIEIGRGARATARARVMSRGSPLRRCSCGPSPWPRRDGRRRP